MGSSLANGMRMRYVGSMKPGTAAELRAEADIDGALVGGASLKADSFAAIVADNDLAYFIGMPAGGYSNTWEWEETLIFPISKKPVVGYMWSIGHTIRPNGEVLEGNPAAVDEYVPQTRDNYRDYYPLLVSMALEHLGFE